MNRRKVIAMGLLSLCSATAVFASASLAQTLLIREPTINAAQLAFVYGGDIWLADRQGNDPKRLTVHPASEYSPRFSPDGKSVAFSAEYDGNANVYLMSLDGGNIKQLTYHPADDVVQGFSPDGSKVLFQSKREVAHSRSGRLYEVAVSGGYPKEVMRAVAVEGAWSADGQELAYRPYNKAYGGSSGWRQHRGGTTPPVWIINLPKQTLEKIPHVNASDFNPMWVGNDVAFVSDRHDGAANVFLYKRQDKTLQQLSKETVWDVSSASSYGDKIVYSAGGQIKELDLSSGAVKNIPIRIAAQHTQLMPQWKSASQHITSMQLSSTGKRVLLTARGDVFTVPTKDGSTRNITASSGVRESDALWSSNGEQIAYISDQGQRHQLLIQDQSGLKPARRIALSDDGFYQLLDWSPDGQHIALEDNHLNLFLAHTTTGKLSKVATHKHRSSFNVSFSADSRWLAYSLIGANQFGRIIIYDIKNAANTPVTEALVDADTPVFGKKNDLYFTASTNSGPANFGLDMSANERPIRRGIYVMMLTSSANSPLFPEAGNEGGKAKGDTDKKDKKDDDEKTAKVQPVDIDFAGIDKRIAPLPVPERFYEQLNLAEDGSLYYLERVQRGASNEKPGTDRDAQTQLVRFDFKEKTSKSLKEGVSMFRISADGKKILLLSGKDNVSFGDTGEKLDTKPVKLDDVKMLVDVRQEWQQIFDDVWRMELEYFYDKNMHGLNWQAIYQRYQPLLQHVVRREDLNDVLVEMIGEMQVGHNRVGGGDIYRASTPPVGLLGADFTINKNRYQFSRIYRGDSFNPFVEAPLMEPGLNVKEGEYLIAVNGNALSAEDNVYAMLQATVGKQVTLTVASDADAKSSRQIIVKPIASEFSLREWDWIEANHKWVTERSKGKVAYIYLPNTGDQGYAYFNRLFFAQADKPAVIIDERRNGGGKGANYITEILNRPYLAGWKDRDALIWDTPGSAIYGPKVMLIDQDAGSGGDFLPYSFKRLGLGKLIGTRTWGGLIGISANPNLIDGGNLVVPFFRFFTPEGEWRIENEGVAPDIETELDPIAVNAGRDPQLERALQEIEAELKSYTPIRRDKAPPMPTLGK